ncbi:conserved hypothetical protein [Ricinus communis]|uniref:Uncharacterized protein n=1 Tax=Ricinus communis TaxID=3988 RepID=B9RMT8_RICCO|nr:conserved hypothetical protein [Ricinus communis]
MHDLRLVSAAKLGSVKTESNAFFPEAGTEKKTVWECTGADHILEDAFTGIGKGEIQASVEACASSFLLTIREKSLILQYIVEHD